MFLAGERASQREEKIRSFLSPEPSIALLLAAVNFEWTVSRAVMFLSTTANTELREKMKDYYSPDRYKSLWREEVEPHDHLPLAGLVRNWSSVLQGFMARNIIVHGKDRYTSTMAGPHVEALLKGARFVDSYCAERGKPLHERMPIRRKVRAR